MIVNNTGQAKPNVGEFGVNTASNPVGVGIVLQNGMVAPRPIFGGDSSNTPSRPIVFGRNAAPKPAEKMVDHEMFGLSNAASSSKAEALSTSWLTETRFGESDIVYEDYRCLSCRHVMKSSVGFWCDSCYGFYHRQCPLGFGFVPVHLVNYFGLDVCNICHQRLQNATPAPFPITRPLSLVPACQASEESDARRLPRRSNRDPKEISRSETPDQVAIIAEHFATEPIVPPSNTSSGKVLCDSDEPIVEALFEINDLVTLLVLPQEHLDRNRSFKIVARHFNSREYPGDNSDDEMDIGSTGKDNFVDNSVINKPDEDDIDDLLGKSGWFYKLDRNPESTIAMLPNVVLWHEDDLELALDDDSADEEDLDTVETINMHVENEVVTEVTVTEDVWIKE